jgi:hypothetical protein
MIRLVKERTGTPEVDYRVLDTTDHEALMRLGAGLTAPRLHETDDSARCRPFWSAA